DLSPYLRTNSTRRLDENDFARILINPNLSEAQTAFTAFHKDVMHFTDYDPEDSDLIRTEIGILFAVLLTTLAIPATTASIYWVAWGALMTGAAAFSYVAATFSNLVGGLGIAILGFAVPAVFLVSLLVALTVRKIGKYNWIKVTSVFVPL